MLYRVMTAILMFLMAPGSWADTSIERRRDQFGEDFAYYIYPIAGDIPGLGRALGLGGSAINMFGTDSDFTGFKIDGDFAASGIALLDLPIIKRRVVLDIGRYDYEVSPIVYRRGLQSDPDNFIQPKVEGEYALGQLTYSIYDRMFEPYFRYGAGNNRLLEVLDKDGENYAAVDRARYDVSFHAIGFSADYTDDRLDPRRGMRLEVSRKQNFFQDPLQSKYYVMDYNLSGFLPMRKWDTLAFNFFTSQAHVTRKGLTNADELRASSGLNCTQIPPGPDQDNCLQVEDEFIADAIAHNTYGTATSLGGTQRLRSYDNGRYYAGRSLFYGIEYRWNITEEYTPFNIYMAKGIRTNFQLAFFAEQGSVADKYKDLWAHRRTSYGMGLRMLLTGVVIRLDLANGTEGFNYTIFITYPWSMFSVDSPG